MYGLNKMIGVLINPAYVAFGLVVVAIVFAIVRRIFGKGEIVVLKHSSSASSSSRKEDKIPLSTSTSSLISKETTTIVHLHLLPSPKKLIILTLLFIYIFSIPLTCQFLGESLEAPFLVDGRAPTMESYPQADYIELHGGAMGVNTNLSDTAEMWLSADRVWHAARLWKAGKAPKIIVTSSNTVYSTLPLLMDFGIPTNAVIIIEEPRNTEEEARAVARLLSSSASSSSRKDVLSSSASSNSRKEDKIPLSNSNWNSNSKPRVLVVSSAWHMKRTMLMYEKYAPDVEAIPAPTDWNYSHGHIGFSFSQFIPQTTCMDGCFIALHEWVGYWGYRWFRK